MSKLAPHYVIIFVLVLLSITKSSYSQKKNITTETYDEWSHLDGVQQSKSGKIVVYQKMPLEGDGSLIVLNRTTNKRKVIPRGVKAKIHHKDDFVAFILPPQHDSIRQLKLDKVKKNKYPKDSLAIYWVNRDSLAFYPKVKSFKISEEGNWVAYLSEIDSRPKPKKKKWCLFCKRKNKPLSKTSGTTLHLLNPISGKKFTIHKVKDYQLNKNGPYLAYTISDKGSDDSLSLFVMDLDSKSSVMSFSNRLDITAMQFDDRGNQLLFLSSQDTIQEKNYVLNYWQPGMDKAITIVDSITDGMPKNRMVSKYYSPNFSRDGSKIYLGTSEINVKEKEDSLLASEKASVDIWTSDDKRIQPEQLKRVRQDRHKNYLAVYHIADSLFVQIASKKISRIRPMNYGNANFALAMNNTPYKKERNWEFPWKEDYYMVDLESGKKKLIKKHLGYGGSLSPSGNYFVWYNGSDSSWMAKDLVNNKEFNLSDHLSTSFASDNNGMPFIPYPERASGWSMLNGEEYYVVRDYYDIWYLHPIDKNKTFCMTSTLGKEKNMRFYLIRTENDSTYLSYKRALIRGIDDDTKDESIYEIKVSQDGFKLNKLIESPHMYLYFNKAEESDRLLIRRSNFNTYPDLEATTLTFENIEQISNINPQQSEYNWGTVEFVEWQAYDSTDLRGLLYKPEDFDSTKKYPMIVYFYEEYQDNIHRYYAPKPTASIVYPTEYVSNDYIIFIPDIRYTPGYPAKSAYNCIVSGTEYLTNKYDWIDSTKLGLQGQSWGGYQTAQLITMTNKYEAAMAGAPVSNMFSAYGGIRWGSGLSRMFQYERTQSRIGYTIWERPDLYIENSPIFGAPQVETPLLIMHNDKDGAVPWYQGIELYMGLRRLNKDVWMLTYNNDAHNLRKLPNKRDLSVRMRQFFDHYLKGEPMPVWMKKGIPAVDKGIETGYETEK